jgi:hypothetical protein
MGGTVAGVSVAPPGSVAAAGDPAGVANGSGARVGPAAEVPAEVGDFEDVD